MDAEDVTPDSPERGTRLPPPSAGAARPGPPPAAPLPPPSAETVRPGAAPAERALPMPDPAAVRPGAAPLAPPSADAVRLGPPPTAAPLPAAAPPAVATTPTASPAATPYLPPTGYSPPPVRPRRRTGLILGLAGGAAALLVLVIVVVGVVGAQVGAQNDRRDALAGYTAAQTRFTAVLELAETNVAEADEVLALAGNPLIPAAEFTSVEQSRSTAASLITQASTALPADVEQLDAEGLRRVTTDLQQLSSGLDATGLPAALDALLVATEAGAGSVESTNFDAENAPRIAFRDARDGLAAASGDQVGESLAAYLDAAAAVAASHGEELAEKAGPLFDARMAVQEFARSLSGGVLLQFDWAPTVNGYGLGGSYGGTSYWTTDDGGQATVTLSDSVASLWPSAGVQALVVHEVGHAVLARQDCYALFFDSDLYAGEEESWATAWAIGLGYTADGSGESIYGRPSDALIALSQQCR